jgi:hypothetical protein
MILFLFKIEKDKHFINTNSDMLGHLETIKVPSPSQDDPQAGFNFLKRECVRMMGTICYKDKSMQDKVCLSF